MAGAIRALGPPWSLALLLALTLALGACGDPSSSEEPAPSEPTQAGGAFDGDRAYADVRAQVELGPRPQGSRANARNARMIAAELRQAGVEEVEVSPAPLRNVVGVIPGTEDGFVVIGAHHDTKAGIPNFVGANDGGSGVALVLELARVLAADAPLEGPSLAIALFDGEEARGSRAFSEDGKRGSRAYVDLADRGGEGAVPALEQIEAMVLFDMVGDCDLQIPLEANSDEGLFSSFALADPGVFEGETAPIDDDHTPFLQAGVPAVDLIDFTYGGEETPGRFWHTPADTLEQVCAQSLDRVGEAAVLAVPRLP